MKDSEKKLDEIIEFLKTIDTPPLISFNVTDIVEDLEKYKQLLDEEKEGE